MVNNEQKYINATKCITDDPEKEFCFYRFLSPKKVLGKDLKLIGENHDGGYALLNDFENIKILYSIGIDGEISFDNVLANKNIDVYMYVHTIERLQFQDKNFIGKK